MFTVLWLVEILKIIIILFTKYSFLATKVTFANILHIATKFDCQPTAHNGVLVLVTGRLKTDDDPPHPYSQLFYLKPCEGNYFVFHDIF